MPISVIVILIAIGCLSSGWAGWESWTAFDSAHGRARRQLLAFTASIPILAGMIALLSSGLERSDLVLAATSVAFAASGLFALLAVHSVIELEAEIRRSHDGLRVSQEKLTETQRSAHQSEAAADEAKRRFLANMSHEMRTPLNGVLGAVELLGANTAASLQQRRFLGIIETSAGCLLQLVDNVLDFTLQESETLQAREDPFDLKATLTKAWVVMDLAATQKNLELSFDIAPDIPRRLAGDATGILRIVMNLLDNAIKFTESGSVTVRAQLENPPVSLSFDGAPLRIWLRVEVEDTGIGIGESTEMIIFEPLAQKDESTTRPHGGTGMGLAVSRRLAGAMGGRIEVKSRSGFGSTFTLIAPFVVIESTATEIEIPGREREVEERPIRQLLVVDDDPVSRLIAESQANSLGFEVDVVESGLEAIEALKNRQYNAVLMDCRMPGLDGLETTRRWRGQERDQRLPVIAVTAHARKNERERCLAAGMDELLEKPIDTNKLAATLERILPN